MNTKAFKNYFITKKNPETARNPGDISSGSRCEGPLDSVSDIGWKMDAQMRYFRCFRK